MFAIIKRLKAKEGDKEELTFADVFINEKSGHYDEEFDEYMKIRERKVKQFDKAFWADLVREHINILTTKVSFTIERFVILYECYYYRKDKEVDAKIKTV